MSEPIILVKPDAHTVASARADFLKAFAEHYDSYVEEFGYQPDGVAWGWCSLRGGVMNMWWARDAMKNCAGMVLARIGASLLASAMGPSTDER